MCIEESWGPGYKYAQLSTTSQGTALRIIVAVRALQAVLKSLSVMTEKDQPDSQERIASPPVCGPYVLDNYLLPRRVFVLSVPAAPPPQSDSKGQSKVSLFLQPKYRRRTRCQASILLLLALWVCVRIPYFSGGRNTS